MPKFSNIEAIILDKDGVFVNFHKVWLRIIAYRAQLIAELSAETSEMMVKIRTACIRAMGVDEDDESIDAFGPCSMPLSSVRLALATALFITQNESDPTYKWSTAFKIVDQSIEETREALSVVELSESFPGVIEKIQKLSKEGFKLGVYTSDNEENTQATLKKFKITKIVEATQAGSVKTTELYLDLCKELGVKAEKTIMITDSPHDLCIAKASGAKTIAVLTGIMDRDSNLDIVNDNADLVVDSLADLDLADISPKKKAVAKR